MNRNRSARGIRPAERLLGALLLLHAAACSADEPLPGTSPYPGRSQPKVLLLTSGRAVDGLITPTTGGYMVTKPKGSYLVPYEQVQLEGDNLHDVYLKQRESMPVATANAHLQLAQWCQSYHLKEEACAELRAALLLEPRRDDVRRTLARLEGKLAPDPPSQPEPPAPAPERAPAENGEFAAPKVRSLSGLPRELAADFVRQVQPILVRKCATAGCHGENADNGFRLAPARSGRGNHRVLAERNLASVLSQVSIDAPAESPLLTVLNENHARLNEALLSGPGAELQTAALWDWVHAVAAAESTALPWDEPAFPTEHAPPEPSSGNASIKTMIPAPPHGAAAAPKLQSAEVAEEAFFEAILDQKEPDAFDPEEFNRQSPRVPAGITYRRKQGPLR